MLTLFSEKYIHTLMSYLTTITQIFWLWVGIISKCWHVNEPSQPKDYRSQDRYHHNCVNMWRHFLRPVHKHNTKTTNAKKFCPFIYLSLKKPILTLIKLLICTNFIQKEQTIRTNYNVVVLVVWEAPGLETRYTNSRHYISKCVLTWENLVHV